MIRKSKTRRYINLIKTIGNWQKYLLNKLGKTDVTKYCTRKKKLRFNVPANLKGIFKEIFLDEFYDLSFIKKNIDQSSIVFDIGANAGYFTIFITEKISPKEIHCFEPFPNNFKLLGTNIDSRYQHQIFLNNLAVAGPHVKSVDLHYNENNAFSPTASMFKGIDTVNSTITVSAIDLEEYCQGHQIQKIDLLKMDCEGAEYDIFYNLPDSFFSKIKSIYMETHNLDTDQNNTDALVRHFKQLGYKTVVKPIDDHASMVWAGTLN